VPVGSPQVSSFMPRVCSPHVVSVGGFVVVVLDVVGAADGRSM